MAFDWNDYLTEAQLAVTRATEAAFRTAASRAYYAAFNLSSASVPTELQSFVGNREESHKAIWDLYGSANERLPKSVAFKGNNLKRLRKRADYSPDSFGKNDADSAILLAKEICSLLGQIDTFTTRRA